MTVQPPSASTNSLDWRTILVRPLRQFAAWLVIVLTVTWAGYPGVVCITPLAWLIALRLGIDVVNHSTSQTARRRVQEAALAGAWFGLQQGLLFWGIVPWLGPIQQDEQVSVWVIGVGMLVMGMLLAAGLAAFTAGMWEKRRTG